MTNTLSTIRGVLIDLDGVLWVGRSPLPGVKPFFSFLSSNGIRFLLVTNNATRRADHTIARLQEFDVQITPDQVLTTADATAHWLRHTHPDIRRVVIVGETALKDALAEVGIETVEKDADAVVVGMDRTVTYDRLKRATLEIRAGARFFATNTDATFPSEEGLIPGAGSIVAAVATAADAEPTVIGKPYRPIFDLALERLGTPAAQTAMIGDRLDTDIQGAAAAGLVTILVLTGVATREDTSRSSVKPDYVFDDLPALQREWERKLAALAMR